MCAEHCGWEGSKGNPDKGLHPQVHFGAGDLCGQHLGEMLVPLSSHLHGPGVSSCFSPREECCGYSV